MSRRRRGLLLALLPLALLTVGYVAFHDFVEAAAFVARAANMQGFVRRAAALEAEAVQESPQTIPSRHGTLIARTYTAESGSKRPVLLVPGVHAGGIDEQRLVHFAREIAAAGHQVTTIELPDLKAYQITPRSTDMIEDAGEWLRARSGPGADRAPGLIGISFSGGLAIVAASRMAADAAWAVSLGGHGDLPRTLRYLCTGDLGNGRTLPPHDYGVVIILLGVADRLVPPEQVEPLRDAIRIFLHASHVDMLDKVQGALEFGRAREAAARLPEPARTLMTWVNERNVSRLGPTLLPHVAALGRDPSLSPERNPPPLAPVYLLHGADDNVVPAVESLELAEYLRARGGRVTRLATPLITHAEVDRTPRLVDVWRLVRFWAAPL